MKSIWEKINQVIWGEDNDFTKWEIWTNKDNHFIRTMELDGANFPSIMNGKLEHDCSYFFKTIIYEANFDGQTIEETRPKQLQFEVRHKTKDEAIEYHKSTIKNLEDIILNPQKYGKSIIAWSNNILQSRWEQMKSLKSNERERAK